MPLQSMIKELTFTDDIYPNSPLAEVVFQIRFPGELAIECLRHTFWEALRDEYPKILVPHVQADQALALTPYRFEREDQTSGIMLAINSLALYVKDYECYATFKEEFFNIFKVFSEVYHIKKLNRAGWRYVNVIPFVREEDGSLPLGRFFNLGLDVPEMIPQRFNIINLNFVSKTESGQITTKLETLKRSDGSGEAFLLDFDYGKEDGLTSDKIETYIDEAHGYTRTLFERLITDDYRQYLRGDTV